MWGVGCVLGVVAKGSETCILEQHSTGSHDVQYTTTTSIIQPAGGSLHDCPLQAPYNARGVLCMLFVFVTG